MKEVMTFAVMLLAVFQVLKTEPQVREVVVNRMITQEKPVYVEKPVVVKEPEIVEKTTERVVVFRETQTVNYREPINQPRTYYAAYDIPYREERREKTVSKKSEDIDSICDAKKPNFFGVENLCAEWRKNHGYDY